jgi:hypothetical protein
MNIQINNLTPLQRAIADMLWSLDTEQEIVDWINTLPVDIVPVAHAVLTMMVYEQIDQAPIEDMSAAQEVIDRIREL